MNKHPSGFSLLALLIILISICLIISAIIATRVSTEAHTLKSRQNFVASQHKLDQQMKTLLATLFIDKTTIDLTASTQKNITYSNAIDYVVTPHHIYDGIYTVTSSAHSSPDSFPVGQEVLVGAFNLVDKLPSLAGHHVQNHELHHIIFHQIAASSDLLTFLMKFARLQLQDCTALSENSQGVVLVTGNCHLQSIILGKANRPVMLIVADGDVTFSSNAKLHGLLIHLCFEKETALLNATQKYAVDGLLLTSCNTSIFTDLVLPSISVLKAWITHNDNKKLEVIAGSWKYH